uniref:Potassium channel domain-containing protein n=1 Tax=Leptocylindrus danicus TaxID=163516 RepID=A0A7S2KDQ0_9STRA|mmetsp:Transcript_21704/g.32409  ORF Transcript_21704/g.32409 Transcript_21704/m.32409 type:complete len:638 (+) Transcript_21704:43-1956(+)
MPIMDPVLKNHQGDDRPIILDDGNGEVMEEKEDECNTELRRRRRRNHHLGGITLRDVHMRDRSEKGAMTSFQRMRKTTARRFGRAFRWCCYDGYSVEQDQLNSRASAPDIDNGDLPLAASRRESSLASTQRDQYLVLSENKEFYVIDRHLLSRFLAWAFRSSFWQVILVFLMTYMTLVLVFTALIFVDGRYKPYCIGPKGVMDDNTKAGHIVFVDAFALSWTTFSTVGYGNIHPALHSRCGFITFLCAAEAFIGVLYAGFSGAIIFAKVIRVQARAPVLFTDAMCLHYGRHLEQRRPTLQYGTDVVNNCSRQNNCPAIPKQVDNVVQTATSSDTSFDSNDNSFQTQDEEVDNLKTPKIENRKSKRDCSRVFPLLEEVPCNNVNNDIPCPVIEFRIINLRANSFGGEILEANLNCVVSLNVKRSLATPNHVIGNPTNRRGRLALLGKSKRISYDEGNESRVNLPRRMFKDLNLETSSHPFFTRVWYARHVLDEKSPLLKAGVRNLIRCNQGYWPAALNDYRSIRKSLRRFNEIIVSLSGTSNDSADNVYARKLYKYGDICIGWQFADILYYDDHEQSVKVDLNLANDVLEQGDGEGEPLNVVSDSTTSSGSEGDFDSYDDDEDALGEVFDEGAFATNV